MRASRWTNCTFGSPPSLRKRKWSRTPVWEWRSGICSSTGSGSRCFCGRPEPRWVESRTGAVALVFRWLLDEAFAAPPQSGLAWLCFLFPLVKPDMQISRIRLSPILRPSLSAGRRVAAEWHRGRASGTDTRPETVDIRFLCLLFSSPTIVGFVVLSTVGRGHRLSRQALDQSIHTSHAIGG